MNQVKLKICGITPLITHNNQTANPLNEYSKAIKSLTSKRKKTDADHQEIARIEWEAGLYLENGVVVMPARCIEATFLAAAKKSKDGKKWQSGAIIDEDFCEIKYNGPKVKVKENGHIPNKGLDKYSTKTCSPPTSSNRVPSIRCEEIILTSDPIYDSNPLS